MNFIPLLTGIFKKGEDLFTFFSTHFDQKILENILENTVVVISSKLVALSQNRIAQGEISELVKQECIQSGKVFGKTGDFFLTEISGIVIPNAGIDSSNSPSGIKILWPENPQDFADDFRKKLQEKYAVKNIGVVLSDSRITPRRRGTTGVALAWSGISGVHDIRGKSDIYGRKLEVSTVNIADNIVSGSEILMGQADEKSPFILVQNFPENFFTNAQQNPQTAIISEEEDLFDL